MNTPSNLAFASATQLLSLYKSGDASPVEATKAALAQIDAKNAEINAFTIVDEEKALADAKRSEARWQAGAPLGLVDGVPATIKDIVFTKGWPTLRGSKTIDPDQDWLEDGPSTARLKEHGAVLLGKTTTPEFGWKALTDSPLSGITRNPWNREHTPGGSSGGAAAACALGMGALHIGTDGGGSIRIPAAFSGVFGIKQSFGLVPAYPLSAMGSVSHVGPIARTTADAALMLTVISQPDARDWYAVTDGATDYAETLMSGVQGLRIAYSETLGYADVDPEVAKAARKALETFRDLGATVEEVEPPFENPKSCFIRHWYAAAAHLGNSMSLEDRAKLDPGLQTIMEIGATFPLFDYMDALKEREALGHKMALFHETYDLLLTPMMPITAPKAELGPEDSTNWVDWTPFSYPFNLTQQPAASVPIGFSTDGLPIALQIIGPKFADPLVLTAAQAFETIQPFKMPFTET